MLDLILLSDIKFVQSFVGWVERSKTQLSQAKKLGFVPQPNLQLILLNDLKFVQSFVGWVERSETQLSKAKKLGFVPQPNLQLKIQKL